MKTTVTRIMTLDMGHRIPNHKSQCRSFHGHTYRLEAEACAQIINCKGASSEGMVIDFSDLKTAMMQSVHSLYDHALSLYWNDPALPVILNTYEPQGERWQTVDNNVAQARNKCKEQDGNCTVGYHLQIHGPFNTKLNVLSFIPTAENLAAHWFELIRRQLSLLQGVSNDSKCVGDEFLLTALTVWETPNCYVRHEP